mgnify:CR=1 FL=1
MQFYLCKVSEISSSEFYTLSNSTTEYTNLYNQINEPDMINVYLVHSITSADGFTSFPWNTFFQGVFLVHSASPEAIAHEFGHYFGLLHTHHWGTAMLPDNSWNSMFFPSFCFCCECADGNPSDVTSDDCFVCNEACVCDCSNSGDLICDTAVDPGFLAGNNIIPFCDCAIPGPCQVEIQLGSNTFIATYTPDYTNLMSYYNCINEMKFTEQQLDRMNQTLHIYPNRANLIDADVPECDIYPANKGNVYIVERVNDMLEYSPFKFNRVMINNSTGSMCSPLPFTDTNLDGEYLLGNCITESDDVDVEIFPQGTGSSGGIFDYDYQVSTLDILLLNLHLLGLQPLSTAYAKIAADVNNSGTLTTIDQILMRRLILGIDVAFSEVPSWRYIPRYALEFPAFNAAFNANPFTAEWHRESGGVYEYLTDSEYKTYLDILDLNLSNPDIAFTSTWGFNGIKMGNVNLLYPNNPGFEYSTNSLSHSTWSSNSKRNIIVKAFGQSEEVSGYQIGFSFDNEVFDVLGFEAGDVPSFSVDNFSLINNSNGKSEIRALWIDFTGENGDFSINNQGITLFKIACIAKTDIPNITQAFSIDSSIINIQFFDKDGIPIFTELEVSLEDSNTKKHHLQGVYPNPTSGGIQFSLKSDEEKPLNITLFDNNGHILQRNASSSLGTYTITINSFDISSFSSGLVYYSLTIGGEQTSGYFLKI